jgi:hypothetical protein
MCPCGVSGLPSGGRWGKAHQILAGTSEIKYPGWTKTRTAAWQLVEGSTRAKGRKPRQKITWSPRLGVERGANGSTS